jgi:hypothetical protein
VFFSFRLRLRCKVEGWKYTEEQPTPLAPGTCTKPIAPELELEKLGIGTGTGTKDKTELESPAETKTAHPMNRQWCCS